MKSLTIVILGGTGDLAKKKLIPAIINLKKRNVINKIDIIATGRRDFSDNEFIAHLNLEEEFNHGQVEINYFKADFGQSNSLEKLSELLKKMEDSSLIGRIFYLATSPEFFGSISDQIARVIHLDNESVREKKIFHRIMIEKPFGYDLDSSTKLNNCLMKHFKEEDIYRVDHYLGKETVQNILVLRLSNPFFERTWNSEFIDKIEITVSEDIGVGDRIGYYDNSGALRDMVQNHLLQISAFIMMDAPVSIASKDIHHAKGLIIDQLKFDNDIILGQYEGYNEELAKNGVKSYSNTETFVKLVLNVDSERWKGTKLVLKTGKYLDSRFAKIEINYKKEPCVLYCDMNTYPNKLVLNVQPKQDIDFFMNTKTPGRGMDIKQIKMTFCEECEFKSNTASNYEIILEECIKGDHTLFISNFELESSWKLIDKIKETIKSNNIKPEIYKRGNTETDIAREKR